MIPKIIWQTHEWKYEDLPENFRGTLKTWKNLNPEWEHRYVDAKQRAEDVKKYDQNLYRYYMLANKITQADIWRYIIIYTNGGVYADMDSICIKPLDYMIEKYYNDQDMVVTPEFIVDSYKIKPTIHKYLNFKVEEKSNWKIYKENLQYYYRGVNNSNFATIKNSKIIKIIIDSILNKYNKITLLDAFDTWEENGPIGGLWLGYREYSDIVIKNKEIVSFNFDASIHAKEFKEKFEGDFLIDNYGEITSYSSFIKENNLEFY